MDLILYDRDLRHEKVKTGLHSLIQENLSRGVP